MPGLKKQNEYQKMISDGLFEKTPKAVLAALLVSEYVNRLDLKGVDIDNNIINEWQTLYQNGIVPQRPPNNKIQANY